MSVRESHPEIGALWQIGQALVRKDPPAVHTALAQPDWPAEIKPYVENLKGEKID